MILVVRINNLKNIVLKCSGSCNNINDPYAKFCVPEVSKHECNSI